jgi:predicted DNA-binding transcriptional regulator AlpA
MMKNHEFTIIASGLDPEAKGFEDRFFEAGCTDATLSFQKGVIIVEFDREAVSFSRAVSTAYEDVVRTGAVVERIEPDHLVSLSEIAERAGMSRQAIFLYARAERGCDFPNPVAKVTSKHPLWDWHEVSEWLCQNDKIGREEVVRAKIVKEINVHLEAAVASHDNFTKRLERMELEFA